MSNLSTLSNFVQDENNLIHHDGRNFSISSRPLLPAKCQESCFFGWFMKMQQTQISLGLCNSMFCPPTNACQMCKFGHICKHHTTCLEAWASRANVGRMLLMLYLHSNRCTLEQKIFKLKWGRGLARARWQHSKGQWCR